MSSDIPDWKFFGPGQIYFLESHGLIKIGYSENLRIRLYHIRASNAVPPTLLLAIPGDKIFESIIHSEFRHLRDHQDWFCKERELMDFIEKQRCEHIANGAPVIIETIQENIQ